MPPRGRAVTPLDSLPPDQRAAVELVLRQGRSYRELGELLGIGESAVRARAHGALEALAPDLAPPAESGLIADWLLGQADAGDAEGARALLARDRGARRWAETVAAPLREAGGERVPEIPAGGATGENATLPEPRSRGAARRRPLREPAEAGAQPEAAAASAQPEAPAAGAEAAAAGAQPVGAAAAAEAAAEPAAAAAAHPAPQGAADPAAGEPAAAAPTASRGPAVGRSSRLGGAILIGVAVVVAAAVIVFLLTRGGGGTQKASSPPASKPAAAQATPQQAAGDIVLRGPTGSKAAGLMRLFRTQQNTVQFALAAQGVPPNRAREVYAIWFTKKDGSARRLGFAQAQVGKDGTLTTGGPQAKDVRSFPTWFATYDHVIVTRETSANAKRPGPIVLSGALPHAGG